MGDRFSLAPPADRGVLSTSEQDCLLYDWLSFTVRGFHPIDVIELLGMSGQSFQLLKGFYGYRSRYYLDGVSIHFDGGDDMGVFVDMSGSGCRTFEDLSPLSFEALFDRLCSLSDNHKLHFTRLDVAFDDHSGSLPLDRLIDDTKIGNWVSPFRWAKIEIGVGENAGRSIYFGSPQSDLRLRIYDKAAERHTVGHWVRVEMQLRRDRAAEFIFRRSQGLSNLFLGVLYNYLRFVVPSDDSNKSRWPVVDYWNTFINGVSRVRLFSSVGREYNRDRLEAYVYGISANAIYTSILLDGNDFFDKLLEMQRRSGGLPDKYLSLLRQYLSPNDCQYSFSFHSDPIAFANSLDSSSRKNMS